MIVLPSIREEYCFSLCVLAAESFIWYSPIMFFFNSSHLSFFYSCLASLRISSLFLFLFFLFPCFFIGRPSSRDLGIVIIFSFSFRFLIGGATYHFEKISSFPLNVERMNAIHYLFDMVV